MLALSYGYNKHHNTRFDYLVHQTIPGVFQLDLVAVSDAGKTCCASPANEETGAAMVFIVMGVSGAGKTTVGKLLAEKLGLPFHDADQDHPAENVAKMAQGIPLGDEERVPWLHALARLIVQWNQGEGAVLACSALKEEYRRILSGNGAEEVLFIFLHGSAELIRSRMENRYGHYFPPALLKSQLETLEVPDSVISVEVNASPSDIVLKILQELSLTR